MRIAKLAILTAAILAAAVDVSDPRPGGTPVGLTMFAKSDILFAFCSCSSMLLYCWCSPLLLLKISPIFVLQLLLLLFMPPASLPADERRPLPDELSLCADGDAHIGLELAAPPIPSPSSPLLEAAEARPAAASSSRSRRSAAALDNTYWAAN